MSAPHPAISALYASGVFHIERKPVDANASQAVMYCGAACWLDTDGAPVPFLDWYGETHASRATCRECRAAMEDK
jgi:hypothetical protein